MRLMLRILSLHGQRGLWLPVAVPILLALAPFSLACRGSGANRQPIDTLESAGQEVAVRFPASARFIGINRDNGRGMDERTAVKVEMPAADWPGFLSSTPIDPNLFISGDGGKLGCDRGFWDPLQARNLRTAQALLPNNRALNIGYDDSRGSVVVVYVVNHSY